MIIIGVTGDYTVSNRDTAALVLHQACTRSDSHTAAISAEHLPVVRMSNGETVAVVLAHLPGGSRITLSDNAAGVARSCGACRQAANARLDARQVTGAIAIIATRQ